jgi:DNA polymerase-3 subunit delta
MKATQKDFLAVAPRAARQACVFFFCGPDEAGAAAAASRIAAMIEEPGERVDLAGGDLRRDPVLLADEARSTSLFAGARHIVARVNGDEAHDAVANHLAAIDAGEGKPCPVLVVASSATDKSRTAKLLEKRGDALVAMFWPPDLGSVRDAVRTMGDELGLKLSGDMAERIARASGLDVRLAQSEVSKLATFLDAQPSAPVAATAEAFDAIGARTEDDGFTPLVNAVLSGRTARLAGPGARRVFWKDEKDLADQLVRWRGPRMERLVARLVALHRELLSNSSAGETLLAQALAGIARQAAR